jgi:hypothetical protein
VLLITRTLRCPPAMHVAFSCLKRAVGILWIPLEVAIGEEGAGPGYGVPRDAVLLERFVPS